MPLLSRSHTWRFQSTVFSRASRLFSRSVSCQKSGKHATMEATKVRPNELHAVLQGLSFRGHSPSCKGLKIDFKGNVSSLWSAVEIPFVSCVREFDFEHEIRKSCIQVKLDEDGEMLYNKGKFLIDRFKEHAQPSAFGHGTETKLDPAVRTCLEIPGDALEVWGLPRFKDILDPLMLTSGRGVTVSLHKMLLYEKGGHFAEHVDSLHRPGLIASLLVSLPSSYPHEGGDLKVRRGDSDPCIWQPNNILVDAVAFFTDCLHEVTPVTKGNRLILHFDICVDRDFGPVGGNAPSASDLVKRISDSGVQLALEETPCTANQTSTHNDKNLDPADLELLNRLRDDSGRIRLIIAEWKKLLAKNKCKQYGLLLKHKYVMADVVPSMLKGADSKLYEELRKEPLLQVRLSPLILNTYHSANEYNVTPAKIKAFVWDPETSKIDEDRAVLCVPAFPAGIKWAQTQEIKYTGNMAMPEENNYLSAAIFVELVDGSQDVC